MVVLPLHSVGDKNEASINHVPLIPGHFVNVIWYNTVLGNTNSLQQRLLPKAPSSFDSSHRIHNTKRQYSFHRARDYAKGQGLRVVLVPRLDVEGKCSCKLVSTSQRLLEEHLQPNSVSTVYQLWPKFIAAAKSSTSSTVLHASTPWSNNSPSGPL